MKEKLKVLQDETTNYQKNIIEQKNKIDNLNKEVVELNLSIEEKKKQLNPKS